jgi:thioredoxin 1
METTANKKKESFGDIINGNVPVLVGFFEECCATCRMVKPILEELDRRMDDKIRILKIDTDHSPAIAQTLQIHSIPTLILFQNGKPL